MDGRLLRRWTLVGLLAPSVGCNLWPKNETMPPGGLPMPAEGKPSLLSRMGGTSNPRFPGPPDEKPMPKMSRKKGIGLGLEGELAFADAEVDGAFIEGKPAIERDALIDAARQRYQKVIATDPKNKAALIGLAKLYAKAGDKERAIQGYEAALRHHPKDHELAHKMAAMQARFGDWQACADAARYALSLDAENRTYQKTLGYALSQTGKWDEAFDTLMKLMPEAEARYFLGRVLADMERIDDAKVQMDMALRANPQFDPAREFLATVTSAPPAPVLPGTQPTNPTVDPGVQQTQFQQPVPNLQPVPNP